MVVFRLSKQKYATDLSGIGAEKYGGRWNSKGLPMLYCSENISLCMLEILVNIPHIILPKFMQLVQIKIPDNSILIFPKNELPSDWQSNPISFSTQKIGDIFLREEKYLAMKVPSSVVPNEFNILLNPYHKLYNKVQVVETSPFSIDKRLKD
ncbi:MAG: hypothetical protein RL065_2120 [Bacteroidota bacterium]|jgi:RES domain-containing protein